MGKQIPYLTTTVAVRRSQADISAMLEDVGFTDIAQVLSDGRTVIVAAVGSVSFQFEVDPARIKEAVLKSYAPRTRSAIEMGERPEMLERIESQALQAGWRFLYFHVKHVCDAIRMNLMSISEGFAGFLRLPAPGGGSMTMANYIAQAEADGTLATPGFSGRLLLEK